MNMLTIHEIMKILPHRYPMLLVDRVLEIEDGKRIVGIKNVTANEQFFQGHFPGAPVMPGVLIVEAMAQCGATLFLRDIAECELARRRGNSVKIRGTATVDGIVVAEAEMLSIMVERPR